jgi:BsuBI/PstI restriction endonuclease domain/BsuBI/PstI restriction endonuclease HTH domain
MILPREVTGSSATDSPAAAAAAFTMMYVGAIDGTNPIRPNTLIRMSDEIAQHQSDQERCAYYAASRAQSANRRIDDLCDAWGISRASWYQPNSREGPRDETFSAWVENGALLVDSSVATTSSHGRYTLAPDFAALLDPALTGDALTEAIDAWQKAHLTPIGKLRAAARAAKAKSDSAVVVNLPGGGSRSLDTGPSSSILKVFIEAGAPALLAEPQLIFISQSGEPVGAVDDRYLRQVGLDLSTLGLLPDCLLADLHEGTLWFIEVVATDGPIDEARKAMLLGWAMAAGVDHDDCRFLTAFESRTSGPAKKLLPALARGSYAWYADESDAILSWDEIT